MHQPKNKRDRVIQAVWGSPNGWDWRLLIVTETGLVSYLDDGRDITLENKIDA